MNVIFILIAVSLTVAIGFLVTFLWTIKSGQYDDEYTPSVRILFDDEVNVVEEKSEVGGQRSEVKGRRSKVGGQRSEVGGQRSEVKGRRSEVRGRRSEVRGRRSSHKP